MLGILSFGRLSPLLAAGDKRVTPLLLAAKAARHALSTGAPPPRPSIVGRADFYVRFGEKEREAVASFDFLDEFSSEEALPLVE